MVTLRIFKKVLFVLIAISLSMSVNAQGYNRQGGNNSGNGQTSLVEEAAKGVVNGVKGLFSKKKDKSDDKKKKEKKDKKNKKKEDKNKSSDELISGNNNLAPNGNLNGAVVASKDDIELTVTGEGQTKEDAKLAALRNALEQAYGVFVSSNTQLLNDEIVKDEIVSISTGIIKHYEILAGSTNGEMYDVVVKAIVTPGKLVSYAKQKGAPTELAVDGATLGANIRLEKMNRENALKAMNSLRQMQINSLLDCFDYEISDMTDIKPSTHKSQEYDIRFTVLISLNENAQNLFEIQKQIHDLSIVYAQNTKTMNHNFGNNDRLQEWPTIYQLAATVLKNFYISDDLKDVSFYISRYNENERYNIYPSAVRRNDKSKIRIVQSANDYDGYYSAPNSGLSYCFLGYAGADLRYKNHHSLDQFFKKEFVYKNSSEYYFTLDGYFMNASSADFKKMVVMNIPVCFSYSLDQVEKLTGIKLIPISGND